MGNSEKGQKMLDAEIELKPQLENPLIHYDEVLNLHQKGMPSGYKTGWNSLDEYYTVMEGQMTVVTGYPGSGKSEFIDALMINLSRKGWKFAVFSFENQPVSFHITKMLEKMSGLPFGLGRTARIKEDELKDYIDDLSVNFAFTSCASGAFSLKDILDAAQVHLSKFPDSPRGVIIDPWNEIEHTRGGMSETDYISKSLSTVRNWARLNNVHVWIVAHPAKQRREEGKLPVPRPDMISGSVHWWNKTDCALAVHRNYESEEGEVEVYVQKCRFKHVGRAGAISLFYDRINGRYSED